MLLNGVREAAIAGRKGGMRERERGMAVSLRESVQQVSDPRNLDASVEEVFQLMLGVECRRDAASELEEHGISDRGGGFWRVAQRSLCLPLRRPGGT